MPYVRPRTKQNCKLSFLLLLSLLTTFLLPAAAGSLRWIVVSTTSRNVINSEFTIDSFDEVQKGLFKTCKLTPWAEDCRRNSYDDAPFSIVEGCTKNEKDLGHRTRATAAFALLAFFASIPLLVLSFFHFRLSMFVDENRTLDLIVFKVTMSRRRGLLLRMIFSGITCFCAFIALCVYGDTMGRWIGCGEHYCSGMLQNIEKQSSNFNPASASVHKDVEVNCGFGFSFAMIIACFFMMLAFMVIILIDFLMKPPKQAPLQRPGQDQDRAQKTSVTVEKTTASSAEMQSTPPRQQQQRQQQSFIVNSTEASPQLLPEGDDWEFDADANLYWSPSQELFFDEASGHFYDPESASWFNPQTQKWYKM